MTFDVDLYDTIVNKHWKSIQVQSTKVRVVQAWCEQNISPRQYWIHSELGGEGWKIRWVSAKSFSADVFVADERYLTLIGLL